MPSKMEKNKVAWERGLEQRIHSSRISINLNLIGISFAIFTFIIAVNPQLLLKNIFIPSQLVLAIPLLMSSLFARSRQMYDTKTNSMYGKFGRITFIIGYSFIINVIGILVSSVVSMNIGIMFFAANILLTLIYSGIQISRDEEKLRIRLYRDAPFFAIMILLGVLPSLGIY